MRLNDRFVLIEPIGSGGMSQVWRATDEVLGRPVAVKTLAPGVASDPALRAATWREARAAARLTHPDIARVYDYGEALLPDGGHAPYVIMELVEGDSLAGRLSGQGYPPLPWQEVARIGAHVAAALAAAHELGVVHHDVKPANVMLTAGGGAKVLDFGTADLVGAIDQDALVGTPSYTAPERLEWAPAQPASDVYSLGVLLREALTGEAPAGLATFADAAAAHRARLGADEFGLPPDAPADLADLLRGCLASEPAGRPPARRVAATLADLAGIPDPAASIAVEPPTMLTPALVAPDPEPIRPDDPTVPGPNRPAPTRIERRSRVTPAGPAARRRLLTGVVVAAAVAGVVLALAVVLPNSSPPDGAPGPVGGSGSPNATGSGTPSATGSPDGRLAPPPDVPAALAEIGRSIGDAQVAGVLDPGAAQKLEDKLRDVAKEFEKPGERRGKLAEKAGELLAEIEKLEEKGELPASLGEELRVLIAPLRT